MEHTDMRKIMRYRQAVAIHLLLVVGLVACGGAEPAEEAPESPAAATADNAQAAPNSLTPEEITEGWELLFDGGTSTGWRAYGQESFPEGGWEIRDGAMIILTSGDSDQMAGGDLVSEAEFENFDLRFEFRVTPVANSGVFYLVQEREGFDIWHLAPEYQVLDDPAYIDMGEMDMEKHLTGENYDLHPASVRPLRPQGEWNEGRILVDGQHVEHWLNGQKMVEYEIRTPEWAALVAASKFNEYPDYGLAESGPIGFQDHGGEVWYRNIKIRRLEGS